LVVGSRKKFPGRPQSRDPQHHKKTLNFSMPVIGASGGSTLHGGAAVKQISRQLTLVERPLHDRLLALGTGNYQQTINSLHDRQVNPRCS